MGTVLLCGCGGPAELAKQTFTFELGSDVYANPDVYIVNPEQHNTSKMSIEAQTPGIAKLNNRFVSTGSEYLAVGEYDFELINGSQVLPFRVKIKDTQPPVSQDNPSVIEAAFGSVIDWASVFNAGDLSEVYYEAPMDVTSSSGEKDVTVIISDRFGNAVSKEIHVVVTP